MDKPLIGKQIECLDDHSFVRLVERREPGSVPIDLIPILSKITTVGETA